MKMLLTISVFMSSLTPQIANAQTGSAPFCLQTAAGAQCVFGTMTECENARGDAPGQCMTRTDARGTTGLGDSPTRLPGIPTEPSTGR